MGIPASIRILTSIYSSYSQREIAYTRFCHCSEQSPPVVSYLKSESHGLQYGLSGIFPTPLFLWSLLPLNHSTAATLASLQCGKHTKFVTAWGCWLISPSAWKFLPRPILHGSLSWLHQLFAQMSSSKWDLSWSFILKLQLHTQQHPPIPFTCFIFFQSTYAHLSYCIFWGFVCCLSFPTKIYGLWIQEFLYVSCTVLISTWCLD